jgi:hypothetical protein
MNGESRAVGEGGWQRWCGFNASVLTREGDNMTKCYRKIKQRQRARLGSLGRKCDTA